MCKTLSNCLPFCLVAQMTGMSLRFYICGPIDQNLKRIAIDNINRARPTPSRVLIEVLILPDERG